MLIRSTSHLYYRESPKEVWDILSQINRSHSKATQTTLRRKLLSIKKKNDQSIQEYANDINSIENDLASSGYVQPKFDKKFALPEDLSSD